MQDNMDQYTFPCMAKLYAKVVTFQCARHHSTASKLFTTCWNQHSAAKRSGPARNTGHHLVPGLSALRSIPWHCEYNMLICSFLLASALLERSSTTRYQEAYLIKITGTHRILSLVAAVLMITIFINHHTLPGDFHDICRRAARKQYSVSPRQPRCQLINCNR